MLINFGWTYNGTDIIIFSMDCHVSTMFYFSHSPMRLVQQKKFITNVYLALTISGLMMCPFTITEGQQIMKIFVFFR